MVDMVNKSHSSAVTAMENYGLAQFEAGRKRGWEDRDNQANRDYESGRESACTLRVSKMQPVENLPHLQYEAGFWHDCANTFNEERKQHVYAQRMGLTPDPKWPFGYKVSGSVLDIGGGPVSLLLKTTGFTKALVQDPTNYPEWVYHRYQDHGIECSDLAGEQMLSRLEGPDWIIPDVFDEVWLYNCLQHTEDPCRILRLVPEYLRKGGVFRFFEWTNIPPHEGHPHMISDAMFDAVRAVAKAQHVSTGHIDHDGCYGSMIAGWVQL